MNQHEKAILKEFFANNQYPTRKAKEMLANKLCLEVNQVHSWFDRQRVKLKKNEPSSTKTGNQSQTHT